MRCVVMCSIRVSYNAEQRYNRRRARARNRIAMRLTPNYVLMKINRYICTSVVSLWAFPRITSTLRPRSSSSPLSSLFLSLSLSLSLSLALFFHSIVLSSYSTPPVWFPQRDTSVYLSISVCPVLPRQSYPHDLDGIQRSSPNPPRILRLTFQVEQSISISQESLLNLEFAVLFEATR